MDGCAAISYDYVLKYEWINEILQSTEKMWKEWYYKL